MEESVRHIQSFLTESLTLLSDSKVFVHLLLAWIVSVVFCCKIFPLFHRSSSAASNIKDRGDDGDIREEDKVEDLDRDRAMMSPPTSSGVNAFPSPRSLNTVTTSTALVLEESHRRSYSLSPRTPGSRHQRSLLTQEKSPDASFLAQLVRDLCSKAKDAGRHPSYAPLVITNVLNYNLDINKIVLSNNLSIFHCACLSCNLELVTSLAPMADLTKATRQGETPVYLAVYAASYRAKDKALPRTSQEEEGIEVVKYLLEQGCEVNRANDAGKTALHHAMRLGHSALVRTLLDWGAETMSGHDSSFMRPSPSIHHRQPSRRVRHQSLLQRGHQSRD